MRHEEIIIRCLRATTTNWKRTSITLGEYIGMSLAHGLENSDICKNLVSNSGLKQKQANNLVVKYLKDYGLEDKNTDDKLYMQRMY